MVQPSSTAPPSRCVTRMEDSCPSIAGVLKRVSNPENIDLRFEAISKWWSIWGFKAHTYECA